MSDSAAHTKEAMLDRDAAGNVAATASATSTASCTDYSACVPNGRHDVLHISSVHP